MKVKPAVDLIGSAAPQHQSTLTGNRSNVVAWAMDTAKITQIVKHEGEQSGAVYKITVGREDLNLTEMGAKITARMA